MIKKLYFYFFDKYDKNDLKLDVTLTFFLNRPYLVQTALLVTNLFIFKPNLSIKKLNKSYNLTLII